MGEDIHMYIVADNKVIKNLSTGIRAYEWFDNLQQEGDKIEYDYLNIMFGMSQQAPKTEEFSIEALKKKYCYGFYHFKVRDYLDWYEKYKPNTDAGWVTTYTAWKYKNKGLVPSEDDVYHELPKDVNKDDYVFISFNGVDTMAYDLYRVLFCAFPPNAEVTYWFDH